MRDRLHGYADLVRVLLAAGWSDRKALHRYQDRRLRALVQHAFDNVPFYRQRFEQVGLRPGDIRGVTDLTKLPVCGRPDLSTVPAADIVARNTPVADLNSHTTSGSTGEPFAVRNSPAEMALLNAVTLRAFLHAGAGVMDRRAFILINAGTPMTQSKWSRRGLFPWEMIDTRIPPGELAGILVAKRPEIVIGLPGVLAEVAREMPRLRQGYRPRSVVISGETITEALRKSVETGFGCRVHTFYGSHEHPLLAAECPANPLRYHVSEDLVLLEVARGGQPVSPGEEGEVLITSLYSFAMPLIRYRLGDWAVQGEMPCSCGMPVKSIDAIMGRVVERFTLPDGRKIHPLALVVPIMPAMPWMRRYQFIQEDIHHIRLKLLVYRQPTPSEITAVQQTLRSVVGEQVEWAIEIVDRIDPHPTGKMRPYFSLLPPDPTDADIGVTGRRSSTDTAASHMAAANGV